jgi:rhodanese-related sulfurtransferase
MDGVMMPQQVPTVPAAEVPADAVVLDVREDDEWAAGHIEGATHIAMGTVPTRLDEVPEGDPIYVTCRSGGRSARVTAWLNQNGYDAVNVGGGMAPAIMSPVGIRRTGCAGPSWRTCRRWSWAPRR